jgi:hypothetical protein
MSSPRSGRRSSMSGTRSRRSTTKVRFQRIVDACTLRLVSYHIVLEQLPLSLHRQFKLMRELDSQSEGTCPSGSLVSMSLTLWPCPVFHAALLTSVRRYIHLRESFAARNAQDDSAHAAAAPSNAADVNNVDVDQGGDAPPDAMQVDSAEPSHGKATTVDDDAANASPPAANQPKPKGTTRTLLQHIAQTSEEAIRAAEEKVNIAQTAYETVRESSALSRVCIPHPCMR